MVDPVPYNTRDWDVHPAYDYGPYASTRLRAPKQPLVKIDHTLSEVTGPSFGPDSAPELEADLTRNARINGEPLGERIIVTGRVLDEDGRAVPNAMIEIWQANSCGRYIHEIDQHDAPLDPNFTGAGRTLTDDDGRYTFLTIRPGAYPWGNHYNAWRPAHIHFSLFGPGFAARLVTQMYFPGDPLQPIDPIFNGAPSREAMAALVSDFSIDITQPEWALGFTWDIVLRGRNATPMENQ
ncbi:MAG: protocatechuate 3,4-dioxygenase subunit beta [Rhodospirillaceae bacterium]|nr:protocatechuate 3,4-dioxygenase subunit beta [Rhodospirillaceae bacterium]